MRRRHAWLLMGLLLGLPASAPAQVIPKPIPRLAFDLRAFWPSLGQDPLTAADLGLSTFDLPARGLGVVAGAHLYPIRFGKFAIGVGGEALRVRGSSTPVPPTDPALPIPPDVHQRIDALSLQGSLNYGTSDGWSYLTAGLGPLRFDTYRGDTAPVEPSTSRSTLNFGGGARWFAKAHLAFSFDMRFYLTQADAQTVLYPSRGAKRLLVLSAGLSIK